MSIVRKGVGVAVAALAAMAMMVSAAAADEASWVVKKGTNPTVSARSPLSATTNGPAVLSTSIGTFWCDASYELELDENPGLHDEEVNPGGVARASLTSLAVTSCTDSIPLLNVQSITANDLPWSVTFDAHAANPPTYGGISTLHNSSVTMNLGSYGSCVYTAPSMVATVHNATSQVKFINQPILRTSGFVCPATMTYTATFDVRDADGDEVELIHKDPLEGPEE